MSINSKSSSFLSPSHSRHTVDYQLTATCHRGLFLNMHMKMSYFQQCTYKLSLWDL